MKDDAVDILLVDDSPVKLLALEAALAPLGERLHPVSSGADALRLLLLHDFAVILLDVSMPIMDGFETATLIRGRERSARTPIIFVSAIHQADSDRLRGYGHGAVDYIPVPIVPEVLRAKVSVFVDLYRKTQQLERANRELAELNSQARTMLAAIVESSGDAIISKGLDGVITSWNAGAARLFGWSAEQAIGRPINILIPPELLDEERHIIERLRRGETVDHFETQRITRDGKRLDISLTISPLRDRAGRIVGASKVARDVTEQKAAEQALRRSEERLTAELAATKQLQGISTRLINEDDPETMYDQILAAAVGIMGSDMASMQMLDEGQDALRLLASRGFDPESGRAFEWVRLDAGTACSAARQTGGRVIVPDVETCEFIAGTPALEDHRRAGIRAVQSTPLVSRSGRLLGMISTHWRTPHEPAENELRLMDVLARQAADLIARHHAERALRDSEEKFRALADNISQLAWMADGQGNVFWFNQRWFEYTGLTLEESRGWGWTTVQHPDHTGAVVERFRGSLRSAEPMDDTFPMRGKDGSYRWFLSRAFPMTDRTGTVTRWFGTNTDVTEQREAQQVLARDRETLERLVAERSRELEQSNERLRLSERLASLGTLSAGLGHDMGNLLLPVRFHLESIKAVDTSPSVHQDVSAVLKCTEYLQQLSHGLRMLALDSEDDHASTPDTELERWWTAFSPVLRGCLPRGTVLEDRIQAPGARLRIPEHHFSQAVFNIVQNAGDALRNGSNGVVRVSATHDGDGSVRLEIADNGPGMPEDVQRRCFEPFFTTKTRRMSTGLGLSLVRTLVTRAGGTVQVESQVGSGTTFILTVPCSPVTADTAAPAVTPGTPSAVVSIPDPRLAGYIAAVLRSFGYDSRIDWGAAPGEARLWVVGAALVRAEDVARFCTGDPARRVVVIGAPERAMGSGQVAVTGDDVTPGAIREALRGAVERSRAAREGGGDAAASDQGPVRGRQRTDRRGDPAQAPSRT